jgi:hypothetical protein
MLNFDPAKPLYFKIAGLSLYSESAAVITEWTHAIEQCILSAGMKRFRLGEQVQEQAQIRQRAAPAAPIVQDVFQLLQLPFDREADSFSCYHCTQRYDSNMIAIEVVAKTASMFVPLGKAGKMLYNYGNDKAGLKSCACNICSQCQWVRGCALQEKLKNAENIERQASSLPKLRAFNMQPNAVLSIAVQTRSH